jgi:glycosyltransferase involved in cell wall biosynthesis
MDSFMRILFLNSYQTVHGGAERLLFDTSTELVARGHKVSIVVAHDDRRSPNPEMWPARINRYHVPELMIPLTDRYNYNRLRDTQQYHETLRYLQDIIDIEEPEIIHIHNFPRTEVLDELRIDAPIVRTIHSYENLCGNQLKRLPDGSICADKLGPACKSNCGVPTTFKAMRVRAENRMMKKQFKKLIAISSYIKDVLITNGFPSEQIAVLNNFTRLVPKPFNVIEQNIVLYVGRLTPEKGLLELIESVSLTKTQPKLLVVGKDGVLGRSSYQRDIVEKAALRGVEIEFLDWCAGDDLRRAYQSAKVVAFSSVWPEPFGLVGIEAMMQGKPVVAFDCGGVRDWLQHGKTGFLVPHLDIRQYAYCLDQLIMNDGLRRAMGVEAQECALERFTADAHLNGLIDIYTEVVNEGSADRPFGCSEIPDAQRRTSVSL